MPSRFTRNEIWQHNGLMRQVKFAQKGMLSIIRSKTATPNAKATADKIDSLLVQLATELRKRDE